MLHLPTIIIYSKTKSNLFVLHLLKNFRYDYGSKFSLTIIVLNTTDPSQALTGNKLWWRLHGLCINNQWSKLPISKASIKEIY